jgi:hypothetical protein
MAEHPRSVGFQTPEMAVLMQEAKVHAISKPQLGDSRPQAVAYYCSGEFEVLREEHSESVVEEWVVDDQPSL